MNRKLKICLSAFGAVVFFILFYLISDKSITAALIGAVIGFSFVWLLAGYLHWYHSKCIYYTMKNLDYMNKRVSELKEGKSHQDEKSK